MTLIPPHDLDAEAAVISSVILAPETHALVADRLTPPRFYSEANRQIWTAIGALAEAGQAIDIVAIRGRLDDAGRLAQAGGLAYLAQLVDRTPAVAHVEAHAARVVELARLRALIADCQTFAAEGYGRAGDVQAFADAVYERIRAIADTQDMRSMVHVADVVRDTFKTWTLSEGARLANGVRTGFPDLDRLIGGLKPGKMYLLAARPGVGKSALAGNVATAVASFGGGVVFFSLEMGRDEVVGRQLCALSGVPHWIADHFDDPEMHRSYPKEADAFGTAGLHLADHPIWIDDRGSLGLADIRARAKRVDNEIKRKGGTGLALVVVDYIQLMQEPGGARTREQAVAANSRGLKLLAKDMGVPVLVLAQMNREIERRTGRQARPKLSDLRESGSLEQDSDVVMFLYRDDDKKDGPTECIVAKQRGGPAGSIDLFYRAHITRFDSMTKEAA